LSRGIDPLEDRKVKKLEQLLEANNTFEKVAREFLEKQECAGSTVREVNLRFVKYVFPLIGSLPVAEVKPLQLLAIVQPIDKLGKRETAHRVLASCGQVFRYGIATARCAVDPTRDLRGALTARDPGNLAAITDPKEVGPLLRMIEAYNGSIVVRVALKLAPLVFVRPGELRRAKWADVDLDTAEWRLGLSKRMVGRKRRELIVPLCRQAVEFLGDLKSVTGTSAYLFPSMKTVTRPMSDNTVNAALRRMGISKEEMCGHGFRAMARTILDEVLHVRVDIIEHQLGHMVRDPNGTAYNRTSFLPERREMMQLWADYLGRLKTESV
jgi:integrase